LKFDENGQGAPFRGCGARCVSRGPPAATFRAPVRVNFPSSNGPRIKTHSTGSCHAKARSEAFGREFPSKRFVSVLGSAVCVQRTTRSNVLSPSSCEPPPKSRVTVEIAAHGFLSREGLLRSLPGALPIEALRFVAAVDLVGLDTTALRPEPQCVCGGGDTVPGILGGARRDPFPPVMEVTYLLQKILDQLGGILRVTWTGLEISRSP
jgi:hypothetical protein